MEQILYFSKDNSKMRISIFGEPKVIADIVETLRKKVVEEMKWVEQ